MQELDNGQTTNRQYYSLESRVKVLNYIKDNNASPYKASEYFDFKYSLAQYINGKKVKKSLGMKLKINPKIKLSILERE
jgi:hypothetical protein